MIKIDKTDELYKYLALLGVDNVDEVYMELAHQGRYKRKDVQLYFRSFFSPSQTKDLDESELNNILDYYIDLKKLTKISAKQLNELLKRYKQSGDKQILNLIVTSQLKDVLYMCLNYKSLHPDVDLQDLVQEANIGIIKAAEKYNEKSKIAFKDYLIYYLRQIIIDKFKEKTNG